MATPASPCSLGASLGDELAGGGDSASICAPSPDRNDASVNRSDPTMPSPFAMPSNPPAAPFAPSTPEAIRTSADLHERLALGARMLQALDVQLRRFEGSLSEQDAFARRIETTQQQATSKLGDLLGRVDQACEAFGGRLESLSRNRLEQWERTAGEVLERRSAELDRHIAERVQRVQGGEQRLAELEQRLLKMEASFTESTARFGEELRRQAEESNRRRDEAVEAMRKASAEIVRLLEHADGVRRALDEDLRQRSDLLERCRELDQQVRGGVESMLSHARDVAAHLDRSAGVLEPKAEKAALLAERLEILATSLAEWRPALEGNLPQQLAQQTEAVFNEGSRRLREQLERVSTAFNSLSHLLGGTWGQGGEASGGWFDPIRPDSPSDPESHR